MAKTEAWIRMLKVLLGVTYKENWSLHVDNTEERPYLQWRFEGPCAITGVNEIHHGRKWYLSEHMVEGELVQTAFLAAQVAEEHETREFFKYKDVRLFGPHISMDALMSIASQIEVRE